MTSTEGEGRKMLTDEQVATIQERAAKATPGPWSEDDGDGHYYGIFVDETGEGLAYLMEPSGQHSYKRLPLSNERQHRPNAAFIAHARDDVPALLADRRTLTATIERMRGALEGLEWLPGDDGRWCPSCLDHETDGHARDCTLDSALASAPPTGKDGAL
jgi:hypothetical protein